MTATSEATMRDPSTMQTGQQPTAGEAIRHREREIGEVLIRHGLVFLARVLGFEHLISLEAHLRGREVTDELATAPVNLRLALEELGPTFTKVGQLLSTRGDLLPAEYRQELEKLQDAAPPVAFEAIRESVERELQVGVDSAFVRFDSRPLAAGSIGQAHAATLHDGSEVVVKVRRPGVVEEVQQDLAVLENCAARASRHWAAAASYDIPGLMREFAHEMRAQLDYLQEGRNAERFTTNFAGEPMVRIPKVFWDLTTSRVLALERLEGSKVTDLEALDAAGIDRHALAERAAHISAKMVFEDGCFHGDPHPGNFFVEDSGRIGIVDFGIVGALDEGVRDQLQSVLIALSRQDPDRLAASLIALRASSGAVDRSRLREDLSPLLARYAGQAVGSIDVRRAIADMLEVARRHSLCVPRDVSLLLRTIVLGEGIVERLDPGFSFTEALRPYVRRQLLAQLTPSALRRRLEQMGVDVAELAIELPGQLHRALGVLADGDLEVHLRAGDLEPLLARTERLGNRIAVSVVSAALINALAELLAARRARAERHSRRRRKRHGS
jgi:ubiquinone biosynthesis protein